jgi:hypothetical protein
MGDGGRQRALLAVGALALIGSGCTERVPLISSVTVTDVDAGEELPDAAPAPDHPPLDVAPEAVDAGRDVRCMDTTVTHRLELQFPEVVVALDRSISMFDKIGTKTWWSSTRDALLAYMQENDGAIAFGYVEFPGRLSCDPFAGCCSRFPVYPSLNSHSGIEQSWNCGNSQACFQTTTESPAGHALNRIRTQYYDTETDPMPDRYVLVITDGDPTCEFDPDECDLAQRQAARLYSNGGINTIVLPLGQAARSSACLQTVAENGHTRDPGATDFPFAADPGKVAAELRKAMAQVEQQTCRFRVRTEIRNRDILQVTAEFMPLPRDPTHKEGWDYDPSGTPEIQIYGTACKKLKCSQLYEHDFRAEEDCTQCGSTVTCP